ANLGRFFADWRGLVENGSNWRQFVDRYGVRRTEPEFWRAFDFFEDAFSKIDPAVAGVLDLSRYGND
ncbi:MAG TPA: fatty acid cis/trans isomerase, partial [Polyangiaceae bacterium]|nr:fatty acid cis/trans isomerase [Polyangiaceae bacterium]